MLKIPGYEHGPLVEGGGAYLDDPLFWPVHPGSCLRGEDAQRAAFGADRDVAVELNRRLSAAHEWPVFSLPLRSGHTTHVVYRNLEGDRGVDYLIHHPAWSAAETLAVDDGHFVGPGTAWPELLSAARQPAAEGVDDSDARLLLLFPTLGDALLPDDAAVALAAALAALTLVEEPAEVARTLLEQQGQWAPAHWRLADGIALNGERRRPHQISG
ncbi:hypothetical protein [Streptomyces phaeochromogenes]|uniref:hypothetical protein n=1 Tax=Streptomyces phaeochromogenes TaxID=1923 RepID=UPI0033D1D55D